MNEPKDWCHHMSLLCHSLVTLTLKMEGNCLFWPPVIPEGVGGSVPFLQNWTPLVRISFPRTGLMVVRNPLIPPSSPNTRILLHLPFMFLTSLRRTIGQLFLKAWYLLSLQSHLLPLPKWVNILRNRGHSLSRFPGGRLTSTAIHNWQGWPVTF